MIFQSGQRLVLIGDSLTDAGRRDAPPFGDGYVSKLVQGLRERHPDCQLECFNRGVGGNTTRDLLRRWDEDVIGLRPDWVSVAIGINDVWRRVTNQPNEAVSLEEYEANLRVMLQRTSHETGAGLILCEPFLLEPNRNDRFRQLVDAYRAVVSKLAHEFAARLVPVQTAFDHALETSSFTDWGLPDRVHLISAGSDLFARTFLNVVES